MKTEYSDEKGRYGFYGAEHAPREIRDLYLDLEHVWCLETCGPKYRPQWSPENPTAGQCTITSFLVQDLFGGKVYGVPLPEGGFHCFNKLGEFVFDLTSEQFRDVELEYTENFEQHREEQFGDAGKRERYELLKKLLEKYRESK
ncbi:MAG: hypothetical protein IJJ22_04480 [Oscillospiraceae bacterium]|nr:hypothetical protein [Oscillospiraceae bacterium]